MRRGQIATAVGAIALLGFGCCGPDCVAVPGSIDLAYVPSSEVLHVTQTFGMANLQTEHTLYGHGRLIVRGARGGPRLVQLTSSELERIVVLAADPVLRAKASRHRLGDAAAAAPHRDIGVTAVSIHLRQRQRFLWRSLDVQIIGPGYVPASAAPEFLAFAKLVKELAALGCAA